jgi:hypothetical protein
MYIYIYKVVDKKGGIVSPIYVSTCIYVCIYFIYIVKYLNLNIYLFIFHHSCINVITIYYTSISCVQNYQWKGDGYDLMRKLLIRRGGSYLRYMYPPVMYIYEYRYEYRYICIYTYIYMNIYKYTYIYIYIYINVYICIHI